MSEDTSCGYGKDVNLFQIKNWKDSGNHHLRGRNVVEKILIDRDRRSLKRLVKSNRKKQQ